MTLVLKTTALTVAAPGVEYWNDQTTAHHVLLDALPVGFHPSADFFTVDDPACVIDLHLPDDGFSVWDGINDTTLRKQPLRIENGGRVRVVRTSQYRFNMKELVTTTVAQPKPAAASNVLLAGQSMMTGLAHRPAFMLRHNPGMGLINAAVGGSSLVATANNPTLFWVIDNGDGTFSDGPLLTAALALKGTKPVSHILFALGHSNRDEIEAGTLLTSTMRAGLLYLLGRLGWPTTPVIIEMPGRIPEGSFPAGFQAVREVYQDIRDTESNVRAYEVCDGIIEPGDGTHHGEHLQLLAADRAGRLIANPSLVPVHVTGRTDFTGGSTLTFSEPVTPGDFAGLQGVGDFSVRWAADRQSVSILHDNYTDTMRYPYGDAQGLGRLCYANGFPLSGFTI